MEIDPACFEFTYPLDVKWATGDTDRVEDVEDMNDLIAFAEDGSTDKFFVVGNKIIRGRVAATIVPVE
jgi:hypothetical protein